MGFGGGWLRGKIRPLGLTDLWGKNVYGKGWVCLKHINVSLFSSRTPNLGYSFETNSGNPFHYFSYGVACSEVEIDCLTGDHKVRHLQRISLREERQLDCNLNGWPRPALWLGNKLYVRGRGLLHEGHRAHTLNHEPHSFCVSIWLLVWWKPPCGTVWDAAP